LFEIKNTCTRLNFRIGFREKKSTKLKRMDGKVEMKLTILKSLGTHLNETFETLRVGLDPLNLT
jgi:hypothetical protein